MQLKFVSCDRITQFALSRSLSMNRFEHLRLKHPEIISSICLHIVEREIGALQQFLGVYSVLRRQRNTDARIDVGLLAVEVKGLGNSLDDPAPECDCTLMLTRPALLDNRELVAAEARQHIRFPKRGLQASGDLHQQLVSGGMPERVVDGLESIKIQHQYGNCATVPLQSLTCFFELFVELCPVGEPGEHIMARQESDLLGAMLLPATHAPRHDEPDGDRDCDAHREEDVGAALAIIHAQSLGADYPPRGGD